MIKKGITFILIALFAVMLNSCGKKEATLNTEEEYLNAAKTLLDSGETTKNKELFTQSIDKYKAFIGKFPKSEKVIFAYNQIAGIYFDKLQNYPEAINTYKAIYENYPDKKEAKQSLFMVAFIYDETLKDKENAKTFYKKFIEKYPTDTDPNDKMTESARRMLEVLESGKSIEDLIMQNETAGDKKTETKTDEKKDVKQDPNQDSKPEKTKNVPDTRPDDVKTDKK
jgi:tetratricopeptide (TPR) repeat protein